MFPFGVSFQEIFFLAALLTFAGGYKKQFFYYSRSSGKFVGRAVGFIRQKRDQVFTSSGQQKELTALQQQLEDAMTQMQHIRYDIRSSARIVPSQKLYSESYADAATSQQPPHRTAGLPFHAGDPLGTAAAASLGNATVAASPDPPEVPRLLGLTTQAPAHATLSTPNNTPKRTAMDGLCSRPVAQTAAEGQSGAHTSAVEELHDGQGWSVPQNARHASVGRQEAGVSADALEKFDSIELGDGKELLYIDGVPLIPVDAEAAGKAPSPRQSGAPVTGADIMESALAEQLVAKKAASLFKAGGDGGETGT